MPVDKQLSLIFKLLEHVALRYGLYATERVTDGRGNRLIDGSPRLDSCHLLRGLLLLFLCHLLVLNDFELVLIIRSLVVDNT